MLLENGKLTMMMFVDMDYVEEEDSDPEYKEQFSSTHDRRTG